MFKYICLKYLVGAVMLALQNAVSLFSRPISFGVFDRRNFAYNMFKLVQAVEDVVL